MRLQDALALMSSEEREGLRSRRRVALDPRKRIDEIEQTARALVAETDLRHSRFPAEVQALLDRLSVAGGVLANAADDPGAQLLCEFGIAFRSRAGSRSPGAGAARTGKRLAADALILPSAFLVQVPPSDAEDPRSLRVCLGFVEAEIMPSLVATVVGRPLAVNGPLALQEVWEVLAVPGAIAARIAELPSAEARLLDAIERSGSEVTTEELLALDQTPGLYRTASGIAVPKRGAPYMLQRRGLLFPLGVDRFVLPSEVSQVVGASRQAERAVRRAQLLAQLAKDDHAPRRARYARDPSLAAAAVLGMLRCWDVPVRDEMGAPRGPIRRIAERLGETEETVALLVALARAAGFGRLLAPDAIAPGSLARVTVADLGGLLRAAWRRGGAWDETRLDPEVARAGFSERGTSAAPTLRALLLDALEALARDRWVPIETIVRFALDDPRAAGAIRIHERARRERPGVHAERLEPVLRAMLTVAMPAIGMVDVGENASTVRLSSRSDSRTMRGLVAPVVGRASIELGAGVPLHAVLALADLGEPDHVKPDAATLVLALGVSAVARARARGLSTADVVARFDAVGISAPLPPAIAEVVAGLGTVHAVPVVPTGAALLVEDAALRAQLLADPVVRRMLLDVDAGAALLVRADVDLGKLGARLVRYGVRLEAMALPVVHGSDGSGETPAVGHDASPTSSRVDLRRARVHEDGPHAAKASDG